MVVLDSIFNIVFFFEMHYAYKHDYQAQNFLTNESHQVC